MEASFYVRWLLKSTKKSATLFALFSTTCTSPPQPYDKKLCSRSALCIMEPARVPFFASFHLLKPIRDMARAQSGNVQIVAKRRRKWTSLAAQDMVAGNRTLRDRSPKRFRSGTILVRDSKTGSLEGLRLCRNTESRIPAPRNTVRSLFVFSTFGIWNRARFISPCRDGGELSGL